jgi:hypothetical protein
LEIQNQINQRPQRLLAFAPVALNLIASLLESAKFIGIELSFCSADFANQDVEVGEDLIVPDKSRKSKFLDWHSVPPAESITKGRDFGSRFFWRQSKLWPAASSIAGAAS